MTSSNLFTKASLAQERLRQRQPQPFSPSLFAHISAIVQRHHLDDGFLTRLAHPQAYLPLNSATGPPRRKETRPPGFFSLASPGDYRLTQVIITACPPPYLAYAHCPEEILWSRLLYAANPALPPEQLAQHHFQELWQRQGGSLNDS